MDWRCIVQVAAGALSGLWAGLRNAELASQYLGGDPQLWIILSVGLGALGGLAKCREDK